MLFVLASQNPNLHSSVSSGNYVYVNQTIVIICTTRDTHYLAWRSVEYIGRGQQLILNSTLAPGYSIMSIMGAVASVVRVFDGNGDLSLQSRLTFSVTSNFSGSSVACENVDLGTSKSVSWNTRGTLLDYKYIICIEPCPKLSQLFNVTCRKARGSGVRSHMNLYLDMNIIVKKINHLLDLIVSGVTVVRGEPDKPRIQE